MSRTDPKRTAALAFTVWQQLRSDPHADRQHVEACRARFLTAAATVAATREPRRAVLVLESQAINCPQR